MSKSIVIIGAGAAGLLTYNALTAKLNKSPTSGVQLTLIEPRDFHIHHPSSLRMVVSATDEFETKSIMNHPKSLNEGPGRQVLKGKVVGITDEEVTGKRHVTLENGEEVAFDVLVLATGSLWSGPLSFSDEKGEVLDKVNGWRKAFREAKDVVLVGGGAVGFELSGEIKDIYPNANVTIVHSQALPLNSTYSDRWRKRVKAGAERRGINVVLSDAIDDLTPSGGKIKTRNGKEITADLVVPTFGSKPNTEVIKTLGADVLNDTGYVRVKPTLQLTKHSRIFAAGDIIEWNEEKQVMKAMGHAPVVAENAWGIVNGSAGKLKEYKTGSEMIILTNGKTGGSAFIGMLWGIVLGDWFARMIKSKTLLTDMSKKSYALDK